jgi:hypothetical protein
MLIRVRDEGGPFADLADFCARIDLRQLNKRAIESLAKAGALDAYGERAALLAGLDNAMALAQQQQRARAVGQTTLFDLLPGGQGGLDSAAGPSTAGTFTLPEVPAAERKQRLAWEKEMIGLYISEHPLASIARVLSAATTCATNELTEEMSGQMVTMGGFIAGLRLIPTKKGDLMVAVELEDLGGTVEVIVFPRTYQQHRELLKEDAVVLVQGKVDTRDDQPKLLCESVEAFEPSAEQLAAAMQEETPSEIPLEPHGQLEAPVQATGPAFAGAQTAYPLDRVEAEAAGLEAEPPEPHREPMQTADGGRWTADDDGGPAPADGDPPSAIGEIEIPAGVAGSWSDAGAAFPAGDVPAGEWQLLLELTMERSAREERDVNRLVRLDHLLGRYPGRDRVVLRFLLGGREGPTIELAERVRCCATLVEEAVQEFGEDAVRIRSAGSVSPAMSATPATPAAPFAAAWPGVAVAGAAALDAV